MFTNEEFKVWWKKNWKYVCAAGVGVVIGGAIVGSKYSSILEYKEHQLDKTLSDAKNLLNNISSKVETTVRQVYDSEAKKAFEEKLNDVATNEQIVKVARNCIKTETNDILRDTAAKAMSRANADEAIKEFIDNNSLFVKRKIVEAINEQVTEAVSDGLTSLVNEAVEEYLDGQL